MEIQKGYKSIGSQSIYYEYYLQKQSSKTIVLLHEGLGSVAQWKDIPKKIFHKIPYKPEFD